MVSLARESGTMVVSPHSETTLLNVAGDLVYARGEGYVRNVRGLRMTDCKAYASIQAKRVHRLGGRSGHGARTRQEWSSNHHV